MGKSAQDKNRDDNATQLIHFLLLAVAKEEGCELEPANHQTQEGLLNQLASTEAVLWSPYDAHEAAQTLSDLLAVAKQKSDA